MKFKNLFFAAAAILGVAASCVKPDDETPAVKVLSAVAIEVPQAGGSETLEFTSAASWELRGLEDWISADKESGKGSSSAQSVVLQFAPNEGADRTAAITIYSSPLAKKTVTVSQSGSKGDGVQQITCQEFINKADPATDYRLVGKVASSVNATYCSFDLNDGTATVVVWTVNNKADWADKVKQGGTVTVRGKYLRYEKDGNVKHEMVDAYIEKFEEGEGSKKGEAKGTGTEADPYNATAALNAASALAADQPTADFYYIKGFVTRVSSIDTGTYGNATFYITDTAAGDTEEFYCYQVMYIGGAMFTSADQLKAGDEVVVYAQLVNYKGNTPETNGKGSGKIISINGKSESEPFLKASTNELSTGSAAGTLSFNVSANVAWTVASNNAAFTVSPASGEGNGTVTISFDANTTESAREATITVTSTAGNAQVKVTQRGKSASGSTEFEFNLTGASWTADTHATYKDGFVATQDNVTIGVYKNSSTTDVKTTYDPFRFYKNHVMVISSDKKITGLIFEEDNSSNNQYALDLTINDSVVATSNAVVTWTGSSNEVIVLAEKGQVRIKKLTITVE